jgi:hypothetical protein
VIGNSRHSEGGESADEYARSPSGPVERDFTAVMFGADWDAASGDPITLHVARPELN